MALLLPVSQGMAQQINPPQGLEQSVRHCEAVQNDAARLACFDTLAKDLMTATGSDNAAAAPSVDAARVQSGSEGRWLRQSKKDPLDDTETVTIMLVAESGTNRRGTAPTLFIRCKSGKVEVWINWSDYLGRSAYVTYRLGTATPEMREWDLSNTSSATFYPKNTIDFINQLAATDKFAAKITPYNENPVTATFELTGLTEAVAPVKAACPAKNW